MDLSTYVDQTYGRVVQLPGPAGYAHYVPNTIPRSVELTPATSARLSDADRALGRLAGAGRLLPNPRLLTRPYLVTEALSSSRIEGSRA